MADPATSLDKRSLKQFKQREQFVYPSLPPQSSCVRDVAGYLKRLLTPAYRFPLADQVDSLSCQPMLLVSAGRSGTTLLRSMLVVGGQVAIPPEGQVIGNAARKYLAYRAMGWKDISRLVVSLFETSSQFPLWDINMAPVYERVLALPVGERSLARIVDEVYKEYTWQHFPEAKMWGDQSPIHSVFLPWLEQTFPEARYLHLLRDGRDVVASMVEMGLSLQYAMERWQISVERARAAGRRLSARNFLEVRYEDLVQEPATVLQEVCGFLTIDYDPEMLMYWRANSTVEHQHFQRHKNLGRPLFTESIGRWVERLSQEEQVTMLGEIGPLLRRVGYSE